MPNRRTMTIIALAGLMLLFGLGPGQTEDYPSRPVRLIITTPAGSLVDVLGRLFAQELSDRLGQTIGGQSAGRHDPNRRGCAQSRVSRRLHPDDRHVGSDDAAVP